MQQPHVPRTDAEAEQAALRRVATAVAASVAPEEVFDLVAQEVAGLLGVGAGLVWRFDADTAVAVGSWGDHRTGVGTPFPLRGDGSLAQVRAHGRPARARYAELPGDDPAGPRLARQGYRAGVAAPIRSGGRMWGAVLAATTGRAEMPRDAEERLGRFAELVGLAIANAEDRRAILDRAAEQAALARVARLVADDAEPREVFALVCREAAGLIGMPAGAVVRRVDDERIQFIASHVREDLPAPPDDLSMPVRGAATRAALRAGRPGRTAVDVGGPGREAWRAAYGDAVVAPILLHGEVWGGLAVAPAAGEPPPPADAEARLAHFAELVAVAIGNAEARERAVDEAASAIAGGALDMAATLAAVVASARRALRADRAVCLVHDEGGGGALVVHATSDDPDGPSPAALEGLTARGDPLIAHEDAASLGAGALLAVRLEHRSLADGPGSAAIGGLYLIWDQPRRLSSRDRSAVRSLASVAELAIANARLHAATLRHLADAEERAATDPLTGLANHRIFHERLRDEVERARRHDRPLALALFDLDHFKDVNDRHGHQVGDDVLADVAARLARQVRPEDLLARIGGEEFAWLLPEGDSLDAWKAAERAREAVKAAPFVRGERCTLSAGVAELSQATDAADLVRLADGALYWAKAHGRDISFRYSPEVVQVLSAEERAQRLERTQALSAIRVLARAVDAKDPSTRRHSQRVADLAALLAGELGWDEGRRALLREAGLVHDVGKIGVPDSILFKPGRLTSGEYEQVKMHAALGARIVADVLSEEQVHWVRAHHERLDGRGYPDGVSAEEIPQGARVLAVADAWDVMTSRRPYSRPVAPEEALAECRREAGAQFCPEVVAAMERLQAAGAVPASEAV